MVVPGFIKIVCIATEVAAECLRAAGRIDWRAMDIYGYIRPILMELSEFISEESLARRMESYNRVFLLPADIKTVLTNIWTWLVNSFWQNSG